MAKSLQEQLLGAGLVDKKAAKSIAKDKKKQKNQQRRSKDVHVDEAKVLAEKARSDKLAKDKALNEQRNAQAQQKAITAQIIQLIKTHKQDKGKDQTEYNFTDGSTIKKIRVSETVAAHIARGRLCIARLAEDEYELVPKPIADKIRERDAQAAESWIISYHAEKAEDVSEATQSEDDAYYAQFEIPDDLMW